MNNFFRHLIFLLVGFFVGYGFMVLVSKADTFSLPNTVNTRLNDYANLLTEEQRKVIEKNLYNIQHGYRHNPEFVVITVPSLDGTSIEDVAQSAFQKWKVGKKDLNNGIVLVLAKEGDKRIRIQTGYGLEPYITDLNTVDVIRQVNTLLDIKDYYSAIMAVVLNKQIHEGLVKFSNDNPIPVSKEKNDVNPMSFIMFISFLALSFWLMVFIMSQRRKDNRRISDYGSTMIHPATYPDYYSKSAGGLKSNHKSEDSSFTSGVITGMVVDAVISSLSNSDKSSSWGGDTNSNSSSSYDSYSGGGGDSGGGGSSD